MSGLNDDIDGDYLSDDQKDPQDYVGENNAQAKVSDETTPTTPVTFVVTGDPTPMDEAPTTQEIFGDNVEDGKLPALKMTAIFDESETNAIKDADSIFSNIKGFGAISRSDIMAFESIAPGIVTEDYPKEFYTESPTKTMFDKSIAMMSGKIGSMRNAQIENCIASFEELQAGIEKTKAWIAETNLNKFELRNKFVSGMLDLIDNNSDADKKVIPGFEKTIKGVMDSNYSYLGNTFDISYSRSEGMPLVYRLAKKTYDMYMDKSVQPIIHCFSRGSEITKAILSPQPVEDGDEEGATVRSMLVFTSSESERALFNIVLEVLEGISENLAKKIELLKTSSEKETVVDECGTYLKTVQPLVTRLNMISIKLVQFEHSNIEFVKCLLNTLYGSAMTAA